MLAIALLVALGLMLWAGHLRATSGHEAAPVASVAAPARKLKQVLDIDGVKQTLASRELLSKFGFQGRTVVDMGRLDGAGQSLGDLSQQLREALVAVHAEGGTRGPSTSRLAAGLDTLKAGEVLFVALLKTGPKAKPVLTMFIDKATPVRA